MKKRLLVLLGIAQFLMVLDSTVMNVSISSLVKDLDTDVASIQLAITAYSLIMAMFMIAGGKLGDKWGTKRAFAIGIAVYITGSGLTSIAPNIGVLLFGWSLLEGLGAALIMPAIAAIVGTSFAGKERASAFAVVGAIGAVAAAAGPLIGGYFTTYLSWRYVFAGEVVLGVLIIAMVRNTIPDMEKKEQTSFDIVGVILSSLGLGLTVFAILQSSSWGWLRPRNSPIEPLGFALTPFVILAGIGVLLLFLRWQERQSENNKPTLMSLDLLSNLQVRTGSVLLLIQTAVLAGMFFVIPLFLQVVLGFDAMKTGIKLVPISFAIVAASVATPPLLQKYSARFVARIGATSLIIGSIVMLQTVDYELKGNGFAIALVFLGIGIGALSALLPNVVQSSAGSERQSELGGLQNTARNFGSALGSGLVGAVLLGSLTSSFLVNIKNNPSVPSQISDNAQVSLAGGAPFVPAKEVENALANKGLNSSEVGAIVSDYQESQLQALRSALGVAALLGLACLLLTRRLPSKADSESETATA